MVFTFTSLPLSFALLFPDVVVVSELNKNIGKLTDSAKKRHRSADLQTPIHPLPISKAKRNKDKNKMCKVTRNFKAKQENVELNKCIVRQTEYLCQLD